MKYARIENNTVMEIVEFDPKGRFVKEIEEQFQHCDESVQVNDIFENGIYRKPEIVVDRKQEILYRLAELDQYIDRPKENLIRFNMSQGYQPYQKELDVINEKESLRQQLQELG